MDNLQEETLIGTPTPPVMKSNATLRYKIAGFISIILFLAILTTSLTIQKRTQKNISPIKKISKPLSQTPPATSSRFFITKIQKPISEITFKDIPNNREIRNVVEYKNSIYAAGNGAIIRYSRTTGEVTGFSDTYKAYCDGELAVINNFLFAACRIGNVKEPYMGNFEILKINLEADILEKSYGRNDGLINQSNYRLFKDGTNIWVATFDGLGLIDTIADKVSFFHSELGYPEVNKSYGVNHILVDANYVWAFFGANAYSQGGVGLYNKSTTTWRSFGPTDLMENPIRFDLDYSEGYYAKLVPGGIQLGFRDGKMGDADRLVEKKYNYNTEKWEVMGEYPASGPESDKTRFAFMQKYPSIRYSEIDSQGLVQLILPSDSSKLNINGRINNLISPVINGNRYILTNGTIDEFQAHAPFRQTLVYLGEGLSSGSSIYDGMQESLGYKLLVDPSTNMGLVIDYICDGMTCENSHKVWLVDLSKKSIKKVYVGSNLPSSIFNKEDIKLAVSGGVLIVSSHSANTIF
ncbi:MAG: hypothetical protein HQK53_14475 [Oligoflexia bacterium]|nr:hypothetical protein [Oligoflexia bacterium]